MHSFASCFVCFSPFLNERQSVLGLISFLIYPWSTKATKKPEAYSIGKMVKSAVEDEEIINMVFDCQFGLVRRYLALQLFLCQTFIVLCNHLLYVGSG